MTPILLRTQTDARLLSLAASGHDRAFEAIVERYRKPLMRYLRRLLSEPLAEDVLQATFLNAWRALEAGTDVRELRPWLYRIGHNQAINALKRAGAALEPLPDGGSLALVDLGPDHEIERRDEMRLALEGVAALPDRQRTALLAVAVEGRAHAEVARELGLSDGAVRQLVHRARSSLRTVATAITPAPLIDAVASSHEVTAARIAELAAGAGSAGVAGFAMKAGAVAVTAGAVVAGVPQRDAVKPHRPAPKVAAAHPSRSQHATGIVVASKHDVAAASAATRRASSHRSSSTHHATSHGSSGHSRRSGRRSGGSEGSGHRGRDGEASRHGSTAPVVVTSSRHRSGRDDGGSSGHGGGGGGGGDDVVTTVPRDDGGDSSGSGGGGGHHHGGGDDSTTLTAVAADDRPSGQSTQPAESDAVPTTTATTNEVPQPDATSSGGGSGSGGGGGGGDSSGGSGGG